jgi:hypothetical protein
MPEALSKAAALKRPPFFGLWIWQQWASGLVTLAALVAYHDSFSGAFVFDDDLAITHNPSIRELWPPWPALMPPSGALTLSGRPLVNPGAL